MNPAQTIKDKQLKIRLLKKAHKLIKSDNQRYICIALESSVSNLKDINGVESIAVRDLQDYIDKALEGNTFYTGWLRDKGYYPFDEKKNKQGRLAWIDWMVACLEEDIIELKGNV